ncbi:MAG: SHOCT domain-containing protein [Parcubacteria group bacterium]|jgi:putative membrane protein
MMYNYWNNGLGMMGFGLGGIVMILFWALIIWAIVALVRHGGFGGHGGCGGNHGGHDGANFQKNSAIDILNERYAKGEINKQEYEEKKKDLEK